MLVPGSKPKWKKNVVLDPLLEEEHHSKITAVLIGFPITVAPSHRGTVGTSSAPSGSLWYRCDARSVTTGLEGAAQEKEMQSDQVKLCFLLPCSLTSPYVALHPSPSVSPSLLFFSIEEMP